MSLTLEALDKTHDAYDADYWADLDALYRGGKAFRDRIENFLFRNPFEGEDVFEQRKREATYRSYMGPIIDHYSSWLFSGDYQIRAKENGKTVPTPMEYVALREEAQEDVDLTDFLKERFTKSLVEQRSHWICEMPVASTTPYPEDRGQFETLGFKKVRLHKVDASDLYYWELDAKGKLAWCVVHSIQKVRPSIAHVTCVMVETWKVYDPINVSTYVLSYAEGQRPKDQNIQVKEDTVYKHGFKQVPLVTLCMPEGMWIANRTFDPQTAHFRLGSALDWSIKRTCYASPVFHLEDGDKDFTLGIGYGIKLGIDEKMSWAAPPSGQFDVISKEVDVQRNDVYRMTHQMSQGMDNNAETVGRSADSKEIDNAATRVMLHAYGRVVAKAVEETYEIVSDAWGDESIEWSIEGFTGYDTATAPQVISNAQNVQLVNVPSPTLMKELKKKVAFAALPEMAQDTKDIIAQEISDAIDAAGEHADLINAGYINLTQRQSVADAAEQAASKSSPPGAPPKRGASAKKPSGGSK